VQKVIKNNVYGKNVAKNNRHKITEKCYRAASIGTAPYSKTHYVAEPHNLYAAPVPWAERKNPGTAPK
jgi:hypothetical protein